MGVYMAKGNNQKFKFMYLREIMLTYTDEDHFLTINEIIDLLEQKDVSAERKSLYNDLRDLEKFGIYVESEKIGKQTYYHVVEKPFQIAELKLLVDSVQSSKFLTIRKSNELINKIEGLCSKYEKTQLQRQVFVQNRIKTMNETVYYAVDTINHAISDNKKIKFQYFNWNINKKMELRHDGMYYKISPWALSLDSENYYLIGYDCADKIIKHFRVDKMLRISELDELRDGRELFSSFDIADYSKKNFSMYYGNEERVEIELQNDMAGVFVDRFGKDISFRKIDETHSMTVLKVAMSEHFISWIFALGNKVRIIGPENVLEYVNKEIDRLIQCYKS